MVKNVLMQLLLERKNWSWICYRFGKLKYLLVQEINERARKM